MPTVLRVGPYRFFFYAGDRAEPIHVHVERDQFVAKFWVKPVRLSKSGGFNRSELLEVQKIVKQHQEELERKWNEYFGD